MTILSGKMNVYDFGNGVIGFFFEPYRSLDRSFAFFVSGDLGDVCRLCAEGLSCDILIGDDGAIIGACPNGQEG